MSQLGMPCVQRRKANGLARPTSAYARRGEINTLTAI